ncbi:MAG: ATPase, T2SS/T4P/T4SS family [Sulfuriferula sp.]
MPNMLDFPAAPLTTTQSESELLHQHVVAHLLDGQKLHGRLEAVNHGQGMIHLTLDDTQKGTDITYATLRYMVFSTPLPLVTAPHPLAETNLSVTLPESSQTFTISFIDGKQVTGKTRGLLVVNDGLHLFPIAAGDQCLRMFVPRSSVKSYQLGSTIPDALLQSGATTPDKLDAGIKVHEKLQAKRIGDYLLEIQPTSVEMLIKALEQAPPKAPEKIGTALLNQGLITQQQLDLALHNQATNRAKNLGDVLVQMGVITPETYQSVLAQNLGLPFVKLQGMKPDTRALALVDPEWVAHHRIVPIMMHGDRLVVAMEDPTDYESIELLRFITGHSIEITVATSADIALAVSNAYSNSSAKETLAQLEFEPIVADKPTIDADHLANEKPLVRLVQELLLEAIRRHASDIHIRPGEDHFDVLFRIDGELTDIKHLPKALLPALISRLKILSNMDISEKRLPQDGQMRAVFKDNIVDMRVSAMPTVNGESMVIRVLDTKTGLKPISALGFSPRDEDKIIAMLNRSAGLILVTGPTGSGKSTTLYAALNEVRKRNLNIITVENPVEYHIDGIMQIQVKADIGYTFAEALRHILRHDPDVILIGEIRDQETAHIALKSALTGHLVLSTLHTNDAASTISRLKNMEVESYLLGSTLVGILAQRLIRKNCEYCKTVEVVESSVRTTLNIPPEEVFYRGAGCERCNGTGYSGRMAVYELLEVTPAVQKMITDEASTEEIQAQAVLDGMVPLTANALAFARQRSTSLAEVYRVRLE